LKEDLGNIDRDVKKHEKPRKRNDETRISRVGNHR